MPIREVRYERLFLHDLEEVLARAPVAYVPAGSLEWHGPHLALGCDLLIGQTLCEQAARLSGGVVLPAAWVASAGYSAYQGSVVYSGRLVRDWACETCRELEKIGFRLAVFVLSHGGAVQQEVFHGATGDHRGRMRAMVWEVGPPPSVPDPGGHAGRWETQEALAATPEAVDLTRYEAQATRLPRYEGLDPAPYQEGLSASGRGDIVGHMSAETWQWEADLPQRFSPAIAGQGRQDSARALADAVRAAAQEAGFSLPAPPSVVVPPAAPTGRSRRLR